MDRGNPTSYLQLADGTPVYAADESRIGEVKRVLAVEDEGIFDGLILDTPDGERFVDAPNVGDLHEHAVMLRLSAEDARRLPEPTANPAALEVDPDDTAKSSPVGDAVRKAWDRISGNY